MKTARAVPRPFELRGERGRPREIVTPEGVALEFRIAPLGDRLGAFVLDIFFQILGLLVAGLFLMLLTSGGGGFGADVAMAFALFLVFVVQNLYFIVFETRSRGQTPGKKRLGIRVMDAQGGPLTTDAIVVRNVMRTLEFWLPLTALVAPSTLFPDAPGWAVLLALGWLFVLTGLPFFNRWNLRPGDVVAGTIVVVAPKAVLLGDVGERALEGKTAMGAKWAFTTKQLDAYGIYELQVLEEVLRRPPDTLEEQRTLRAVADRISKKIGWPAKVPARETREFLQHYYAALRLRLEQRMLFGRRKEDKHDA